MTKRSTDDPRVDRRAFFSGRIGSADAQSDDASRALHISSAVVTAFPHRCAEIAREIESMPMTEVRHIEGGKIIVLLEGRDSGEVGGRLAAISTIDGVLSANMVYEQRTDLDGDGGLS